MTQTSINFTQSGILNPFKRGSQNHRLLERLKEGPVSNREIMRMYIPKYTGRLSEIREMLRPFLMDLKAERTPGTSEFVYSLRG